MPRRRSRYREAGGIPDRWIRTPENGGRRNTTSEGTKDRDQGSQDGTAADMIADGLLERPCLADTDLDVWSYFWFDRYA